MKAEAPNRQKAPAGVDPRAWLLSVFTLLLAAGFWSTLRQWYAVSQSSENFTHLVLMPLVFAYLLYTERERIFAAENAGKNAGAQQDRRFVPALLVAAVAALGAVLAPLEGWSPADQSSLRIALVLAVWISAFALLFGAGVLRRALFPLAMLAFMVPIPSPVLDRVIAFLVWGSAEGTAAAFALGSLPYFRDGYTFLLPEVAIEVAEECSGIRSTMALLITGLLAGHMFLATNSARALLALAVIPLAIVKNVIRIFTLTYLAVYVDPEFLTGRLHKRGGFLFFLITLLLLGLVLFALRWWERRRQRAREAAASL